MYDLIGDIHGHHGPLTALLRSLGYEERGGGWAHPGGRKVLFCGDYVDRGPAIREVLGLVKRMVDEGHAIALMGNHEYNALCFHTEHPEGGHLRRHTIKNMVQHHETVRQFQHHEAEFDDYLRWFRTLPMYLDMKDFRVVHACWKPDLIAALEQTGENGVMSDAFLRESSRKGAALKDAVEIVLKGTEATLPEGVLFVDKDGTHRKEIRTKWWENPIGKTWREWCVEDHPNLTDELAHPADPWFYGADEVPVFVGHYWLKGQPALLRDNVCCLDYSIAKGGKLVAYRWDGEARLSGDKLVYV